MLVNVYGAKCIGIEAVKITVEIDITRGVGIHLVGLADTAVKESLLRTITALQSLGYHIPGKKIVINLAPADLHKSGSGYDLPIALGIIACTGQRSLEYVSDYLIMGELGLDGTVRDIYGALPIVEFAQGNGFKGCILPLNSALEAVEMREGNIYGVTNFEDVVRILEGKEDCSDLLVWNRRECRERGSSESWTDPDVLDFARIVGQEAAKRGAEIAAAGNHSLILIGPPGTGKSTIAKAMTTILPPMTKSESLTTRKIYSIAGKGELCKNFKYVRPFRAPHCSASLAALIGGGNGGNVTPGEVSLAHNGVLFLDEFALIPKSVTEALRAPMEDRKVTISRLRTKIEYPSSFMLVAASNPCPCGFYGDGNRCRCTPGQRMSYLSHLSGPIMDRIDLQVWVGRIPSGRMMGQEQSESSARILERVVAARKIQECRFEGERISTNGEMTNSQLEKYCPLSAKCRQLLEKLIDRMNLSMRSMTRIIKVARTIADLEGSEHIQEGHILEAASFRFIDKLETDL